MESSKYFLITAIVTVSTLNTVFITHVASECVPLGESFVIKSLLPVFPPSASPSPSPAQGTAPKQPVPKEIKSPAASPTVEKPVAPSLSAKPATKPTSSAGKPLNPPMLSPEIKSICSKTDHPQLCESSISPLITPQVKPDPVSILVLAIQASINATKTVMTTDDKVSAADCQEFYDDAVSNMEDAITAVKSNDIDTVNTNLSAAMTDYSTCNDGFEETGEPNPLADVSDNLMKMVSNCLAISSLVK